MAPLLLTGGGPKTTAESTNNGSSELAAQDSAHIYVFHEGGASPLLAVSWNLVNKELSVVLATTRHVQIYGRDADVDVEALVAFVADYVESEDGVFPLTAKTNYGHRKTLDTVASLTAWLLVNLRLVRGMTQLWSGAGFGLDDADQGLVAVHRGQSVATPSSDEQRHVSSAAAQQISTTSSRWTHFHQFLRF